MSATVPLFVLLVLVHFGIFVTSAHHDRLRRLLLACAIMVLSIPGVWLGMMLPGNDGLLRGLLIQSPLILALLAFLAYLRRG